jgi:hypothetical protein
MMGFVSNLRPPPRAALLYKQQQSGCLWTTLIAAGLLEDKRVKYRVFENGNVLVTSNSR